MQRRLARAACVLVAGLTLATVSACGDDTPPPATISTPPAANAPASPTPAADLVGQLPDFSKWQDEPADIPVPELPRAATKETKAGAIAFAKHYLDLWNYAVLTGDASPANRLSPNCSNCKMSANSLASVLNSGGRYRGDPRYLFKGLEMAQFTREFHKVALCATVGQRQTATPKDGKFDLKTERVILNFSLSFSKQGRWSVDDLQVTDAT